MHASKHVYVSMNVCMYVLISTPRLMYLSPPTPPHPSPLVSMLSVSKFMQCMHASMYMYQWMCVCMCPSARLDWCTSPPPLPIPPHPLPIPPSRGSGLQWSVTPAARCFLVPDDSYSQSLSLASLFLTSSDGRGSSRPGTHVSRRTRKRRKHAGSERF